MHRAIVAAAFAALSLSGVASPSAAAQAVVMLAAVGGSGETGRVELVDVPAGAPVLRVSATLVGEPRSAIQPLYLKVAPSRLNEGTQRRLASVYHGESVTILPGFTVRQLIAARASFEVHRSATDGTVLARGTVPSAMLR